MKVYLASKSPRRRELLGQMGVVFEIVDAESDEEVPEGTHPKAAVELLARRKCEGGCAAVKEGVVIGSDTLVELNGAALGKPQNEEDAVGMLMALSGKTHRVYTGVAVARVENGAVVCELSSADTTMVVFRAFDEEEARAYVATGEPMDKAGAYGIQGLGGRLVDHIEGALDNVIGFPTELVRRLLEEVGEA